MMKAVYPIPDRCINCHLCEVACVVEHSATKNPVGAYCHEGLRFNWEQAGRYPDPSDATAADCPPPTSRCRVWAEGHGFVSTMCRHCDTAACVLACKNGSLARDETGRVLVDEDRCVGCWMCIMACPFGVITRNVHKQNVPGVQGNGINHHCDLCPNRPVPACVATCPTRALVYEER